MPNPNHSKIAAIEMASLEQETLQIAPLLSDEDRGEKKKEWVQRMAVIAQRETKALREEAAAMDAELAQSNAATGDRQEQKPVTQSVRLAQLLKEAIKEMDKQEEAMK
ncbi:MAG: hypothetical protein ABIG34_04855 [Candidatus Peregrinibacteria bacterium]